MGDLRQSAEVRIDADQSGAHRVDRDVAGSSRSPPLHVVNEPLDAAVAPTHAALHADGRRIPSRLRRRRIDDRLGLVEAGPGRQLGNQPSARRPARR